MGNMGWVEWLIILAVVLLIFGGSKLKSLGSDLGSSIKGFKKAVKDDESKEEKEED
mgnify:FL=1|tara:strand:+ start:401 stop:568 length:168 start_codon:yes stop_codon:yes gene_type:complete